LFVEHDRRDEQNRIGVPEGLSDSMGKTAVGQQFMQCRKLSKQCEKIALLLFVQSVSGSKVENSKHSPISICSN